jgi:gamma-glutamylcyclotransferase (GGCT)/AIG2-like uncharacterized protein YtfP
MSLIFVYGTLKRGGTNHHCLADQKFVGEARTAAGFCLYNVGSFPGMVHRADDHDGVAGEVWEVSAECLAKLDELEDVAHGMYRREKVPMAPPWDQGPVETYIYLRSVRTLPKSGSIWPV